MAAKYQKHSISFFYPENWKLDEDESEGSTDVSLQAPNGAVWAVTFFDQARDPNAVAKEALSSFADDFEDLESVSASETVQGITLIGYDINFIMLDFVVTGSIRSFVHAGRSYCILRQAETREFDELKELHDAITFSLLTGMDSPAQADPDNTVEISTNQPGE